MTKTTRILTYQGDMLVGDSYDEVSMADGAYSWQFDGVTNQVTVPHNTVLNFSNSDWTIEFWALPTSTDNVNRCVYSKRATVGTSAGVIFEFNGSTGYWTLAVANNAGTLWTINTTTAITGDVGVWQHIAFVRQGAFIYAYKNGARTTVSSAMSTSIIFDDGTAAIIGSESPNVINSTTSYGANRFRGLLSNFRITKGVALYTDATVTIPLTPLINQGTVTSLLTCQSNTFKDNSSYNHALYDQSAPAISYSNPFFGEKSVRFTNNTSRYLSISTAPVPATGAFTLECWIFTTVSGIQTIYSQYLAADANRCHFSIDSNSGYKLSFAHGTAATVWGNTVVPLNQWNHVAVCRDSSNNLMIFLNGILDGFTYYTSTLSTSTPRISAFVTTGTAYPFQGYISNFHVVSGRTLYGITGIDPPETAITNISGTSLLTAQSSTIIDNSSNAYTITNVNTVTSTSSVIPFANTYSYSFNGSTQRLTVPAAAGVSGYASDFTIEAWIYPTAVGATAAQIAGQWKSTTGRSWQLLMETNRTISFNSTGFTGVNSGTAVSLNSWSHIVVIKRGSGLYVILNGIIGGLNTSGTMAASTDPVMIGANNDSTNPVWFFTGYISNLRIVKGSSAYTFKGPYDIPSTSLSIVSGTSLLTCTGPTIKDYSKNAYTVTNNGQLGVDEKNPFSTTLVGESSVPVAQRLMNSVSFNGVTNYLSIPNSAAFDFGSTTDFTIEAWVYPTTFSYLSPGTPDGFTILSSYSSGTPITGWAFTQTPSGTLTFTTYVSGTQQTLSATSGAYLVNTWNHVVITRVGSTFKFFVNGTQTTTSGSITQAVNTGGTIKIGALAFSTYNDNYAGYISNVRVVKGISVYTGNFTVPTSPLATTQSAGTNIAAITSSSSVSLLTCQGYGTFRDASDYGHQINTLPVALTTTSRDITTTSTKNPFTSYQNLVATNSYYSTQFNGTSQYLTVPSTLALGTGDFTIECWSYLYSRASTYPCIFANYNSFTTGALSLFAGHGSATTTQYQVAHSGTFPAIDAGTIVYNTWVHLALVRKSGTLTLYVNGVSVGTYNSGTTNITGVGSNFTIGYPVDTGLGYINGLISNFRVVLNNAVYTANFTPPTSPLNAIAGTQLLTCQSPVIQDNSSTPYSISTTGNPLADSTNPFRNPLAYYSNFFEGTSAFLSTPSSTAYNLGATYTIEFWAYRTASTTMRVISRQDALSPFAGFSVVYNGTSWIFDASGTQITVADANLNQWVHYAWVVNSTSARVYRNGVSVGTGTQTAGTPGTNTTLYISRRETATAYFKGYISNLRVVKGVAVYSGTSTTAANFVVPTAPLSTSQSSGTNIAALTTADVVLLACNNGVVKDVSSIQAAFTNNGTQAVVTSKIHPFYLNPPNLYSQIEFPAMKETAAGVTYTNNYLDDYTNQNNRYYAIFNGSNYLSIASNAIFQLGLEDFTIECWFCATDISSGFNMLIDMRNGVTTAVAPELFIGTNINYYTANVQRITGSAISTNTWYHVAVSRNNGSTKLYLNGTQVGSTYADTNNYIINSPKIGVSSGLSSGWFIGYISNFRIIKGIGKYPANFDTKGLYPLTNVNGTTLLTCQNSSIVDNSSYASAITNTGSVTTKNPIFINQYSASFNGTNQYLKTPSNTAFTLGTGDFTIECWINGTSFASNGLLVDFRTATLDTAIWILVASTDIRVNVAGSTIISNGAPLSTGQWYHVAVTKSSGITKLFLNGVLVGSYTDSNNYVGTIAWIGSYNNAAAGGFFNGQISNFHIVKGVSLYNNNFIPQKATISVISATSLLTCHASTIIDSSSNNFTITNTGTVPVVSTIKPVARKYYNTGINEVAGLIDDSYSSTLAASTYFNGTNQTLFWNPTYSTSGGTASGIAFGTSDFTVEMWFNSAQKLNNQMLIDTRYVSVNSWSLGFGLGSPSYPGTLTFAQNNGAYVFNTSYSFSKNTWYHIALVRISGTFYFYVNGVQQSSNNTVYNMNQVYTGATIGARYDSTNYWKGYISNLRIVNGLGVYTGNFTPPNSALQEIQTSDTNIAAITNPKQVTLLTCQTGNIIDNSPYNFTINNNYNINTSTVNKPF